jgi:cytoskeletal protein RodZ
MYGDKLTFNWFLNDTKLINTGTEINLSLPAGIHGLTLNVSDEAGAWCSKSTTITIFNSLDDDKQDTDDDKVNDTKDNDKGDDKKKPSSSDMGLIFGLIGIVVIIIISMIVMLIIMKKKKKNNILDTKETQETQEKLIETVTQSEVQFSNKSSIEGQTQQPEMPARQPPGLSPQIEQTPTQPIITTQPPQLQPQQNICSTCGQALTYYNQNNKYYCHHCNKYE